MPLTTGQELVSAIKMSLPFPEGGGINEGDLPHITWNFSGLNIAAGVFAPVWTFIARTRTFVFPATRRGTT